MGTNELWELWEQMNIINTHLKNSRIPEVYLSGILSHRNIFDLGNIKIVDSKQK